MITREERERKTVKNFKAVCQLLESLEGISKGYSIDRGTPDDVLYVSYWYNLQGYEFLVSISKPIDQSLKFQIIGISGEELVNLECFTIVAIHNRLNQFLVDAPKIVKKRQWQELVESVRYEIQGNISHHLGEHGKIQIKENVGEREMEVYYKSPTDSEFYLLNYYKGGLWYNSAYYQHQSRIAYIILKSKILQEERML